MLENGRLPRRVRSAFSIEADRQAKIAEARHGKKPGTREYHLARLEVEVCALPCGQETPD